MPKGWTIQWKAFLMLVVFTVNFCVVCHCAANAVPRGLAHHHTCCEKSASKNESRHGSPGENPGDCSGMQAVKFNLLEKQVSSPIHSGEQPVLLITHIYSIAAPVLLTTSGSRRLPDEWAYKHAPPDRQALYQSFLI
jgi:hypothetical protein